MEFIRITDIDDVRFKQSMQYYSISFPKHEQRENLSQRNIMPNNSYHFTLISNGNENVGTILFWETDNFIYIEHFYIYPDFRGNSYGALALKKLQQYEKTIILEIDPPLDTVSIRRKIFYERNGFTANDFVHVHPPYHHNNRGHNLIIMSYPNSITSNEYNDFNDYLKKHIMADVF